MKRILLAMALVIGIAAVGWVSPRVFGAINHQTDASQTPATEVDHGWPRTIVDGTETFNIYQPQVDRWEGNVLEAYSAVEVATMGSKNLDYGVIYFTAQTSVDKVRRLVKLDAFHITKCSFPGDPDQAKSYEQTLQKTSDGQVRIIALDRLEANLAITKEQKAPSNRQLNNEPPRIIISTEPVLMIAIDGSPELRPVPQQANLLHVINTRALILYDNDTNAYSLCTLGGWFSSSSATGPWAPAATVPDNYILTKNMLVATKAVEVLDQGATSPSPGAKLPDIYVCTTPTELILVQGEPQFTAIENSNLLYVSNTDSDIFMDSKSKQYFVTISGRWFQSASVDGPWSYVNGRDLPTDFAKIPETSPKAGVLVSIPGTRQAQEAVIANDIPQTAIISRSNASLTVGYDGEPQFKPIVGTRLSYAVNTATPVVLADNGEYYAVDKGVWYVGVTSRGPWDAADSVPESIYSIPPTSPIYNITYVRVYRATPDEVYCGYTPGYYGTVESPEGVVDYGTGYNYAPYLGNVWFGAPITYGFGASFGWSSLGGWSLDFGLPFGLPMYMPWSEPVRWGWNERYGNNHRVVAPNLPPRNRTNPKHNGFGGFASLNVYSQPGSGQIVRPAHAVAGAAGPTARGNNVYATRDGQVYRHQQTGWQVRDGAGWRNYNGVPVQQLQRQHQGRITGGQRYQNFGRQGGIVSPPSMPVGGGARRR